MIENFVAFDFETASGKNPCSIGLIEFNKGKVVNKYYSLINPEIKKFNPFAVAIHGIKEKDVKNEKTFDLVWQEISHFFDGKLLVAHNSSFDLSVLIYSLDRYNIIKPNKLNCICTLKMSKNVLKLNNYKLDNLAEYYSIEQYSYHNALEDAQICGKLFKKLCSEIDNIDDFVKSQSYDSINRKIRQKSSFHNKKEQMLLDEKINFRLDFENIFNIQTNKLEGNIFVVSGVFDCISRTELKKLIEDNGGKVSSSISSKTNYVVAGDKMGPSKKEKAEKIGVEIISEDDFLLMIK